MSSNIDDIDQHTNQNKPRNGHSTSSSSLSSESSSSSSSSASSISSPPSSSSVNSSSSSELDPNDALQSPLAGLLKFEGFSMPQIRNLGISNIDMPMLPSLPTFRSFNMPRFQSSLPSLAINLTNLQNLTTNMPTFPNLPNFPNFSNLPNLPNLSLLTNAYTSAELQNLFNSFRRSTNLPTFPPLFPTIGQLSNKQLYKPRLHLKDSVRNMHRRLSDITQRFPTNFQLTNRTSADGSEHIRIYFLLNDFIYYCDSIISENLPIRSKQHSNTSNTSNSSSGTSKTTRHHKCSPGQRCNNGYKCESINAQPLKPVRLLDDDYGRIESYEFDAKTTRFIFSIGPDIYYFDEHPSSSESKHIPTKLESNSPLPKSDIRICPSNSDLIAYHCDGNLWCVNIKNFKEIQLTDTLNEIPFPEERERLTNGRSKQQPSNSLTCASFSNNSGTSSKIYNYEAAPVIIGRPSNVIREEFRRHQGFWWRPETDYHVVSESGDYIEHQILYELVDQSQVEVVNLMSSDGSIEEQRYPKSGQKNPISKLRLVKFKVSVKDGIISDVQNIDIVSDLRTIYSECEYLVRLGWLGQDVIWCQLMNRRQTNLVIAVISLNNSFKSQIIYEETNDVYWVSAHDNLYFLNTSKIDCSSLVEGSELTFIWSSEESGHRHLYLIKSALGGKSTPSRVIFKRQLTEGYWEVNEKDLWVDETEMLIYFCGLRETPLEKQLYVLSYADCLNENVKTNNNSRIKIHRLTELNYTHSTVAFNEDRTIFVNIQSNISVPLFGFVNRIVPQISHKRDTRRLPDSRRLSLLLVNSVNFPSNESSYLETFKSINSRPALLFDCQADLLPGLNRPELFCCQLSSGELLYGSIFKPEFMESGVSYPTVLEIYGGPEVQLVSNNFMSLRSPTRHLLSSEGYVVVLIDARGSGRRGISFEAHSFHRMGQVEVADHIEVLQWLAKNTGYIDLERIAVLGWSYGGYLALMALAQYPKFFKLAIAGAPVTNWHMYDSAYTERFMGLPDENKEGYFKGSVLNYVHLFPDEGKRLLLLHGMMDENVHFSHTVSLIKALVEAGKPYDLQLFPLERHILKSPAAYENYMTCVLSYLQLNL